MTCRFCEQARNKMKLLTAMLTDWHVLRRANPEQADEIDTYYREQYRRVSDDINNNADQT
jgi:hypothetical protein